MKTSSQGLRIWLGSCKQWEAPSGICASKLGGLASVAPVGWGKGHVHLKESLRFWKRLLVSLANFIISMSLCQHQRMPSWRERQETTGCQGGAQRGLGPELGLLPRGQTSTLVKRACWKSAKGKRGNGAATFNSIKKEPSLMTSSHKIDQSVFSLKNMCSIFVITLGWHQRTEFVDNILKKRSCYHWKTKAYIPKLNNITLPYS